MCENERYSSSKYNIVTHSTCQYYAPITFGIRLFTASLDPLQGFRTKAGMGRFNSRSGGTIRPFPFAQVSFPPFPFRPEMLDSYPCLLPLLLFNSSRSLPAPFCSISQHLFSSCPSVSFSPSILFSHLHHFPLFHHLVSLFCPLAKLTVVQS